MIWTIWHLRHLIRRLPILADAVHFALLPVRDGDEQRRQALAAIIRARVERVSVWS